MRSCELCRPSVLPHIFGVPKWFTALPPASAGPLQCIAQVIPFGERSLRRALAEFLEHYHAERNHQGKAMTCCSLQQTRRSQCLNQQFNANSDSVVF